MRVQYNTTPAILLVEVSGRVSGYQRADLRFCLADDLIEPTMLFIEKNLKWVTRGRYSMLGGTGPLEGFCVVNNRSKRIFEAGVARVQWPLATN